MDLKMHLQISDVLIDSLNYTTSAEISPFWFRLGSIMPDISLVHRIQEHHITKSNKFVKRYIDRIRFSRVGTRMQSFLLGKTSHFLSDTFCLMHNHVSGKNLRYHMQYEKQLSAFFESLSDHICLKSTSGGATFSEAQGKCLITYILEKNFEYYKKHHPLTMKEQLIHDISYLYFTCLNVLSEMIQLGKKPEMAVGVLIEEAA